MKGPLVRAVNLMFAFRDRDMNERSARIGSIGFSFGLLRTKLFHVIGHVANLKHVAFVEFVLSESFENRQQKQACFTALVSGRRTTIPTTQQPNNPTPHNNNPTTQQHNNTTTQQHNNTTTQQHNHTDLQEFGETSFFSEPAPTKRWCVCACVLVLGVFGYVQNFLSI